MCAAVTVPATSLLYVQAVLVQRAKRGFHFVAGFARTNVRNMKVYGFVNILLSHLYTI